MTGAQIAGNILTGIGMFLFFLSSFFKSKQKIVLLQTGNHTLSCIGQICLKQYSGSIQDAVSIIRNICILFKKNNKILNWFFIALGLILGTVLNVVLNLKNAFLMGIGFLPVFASFQYSIIILFPNIKVPFIKASMAVSCVCWTIYGLFLKNYSMVISNIIIFVIALIAVVQYFIQIKKEQNMEDKNETVEEE
ncbi:MAG: YgjV family protein [Anaeroplasmataceae bacterium]|nr:YgjV family protein [Anaeroplasmataceae bacterium]